MKKLSQIISVSVLALLFLSGIAYAQTWGNPGSTAPNGNIFPPVNTGSVAQEKTGWLGSGNFYGNRRLGATEIRTESLCIENQLNNPSGYIRSWTQGLLNLPQTNCITDWSQVGGSGSTLPTNGNNGDVLTWDSVTQTWIPLPALPTGTTNETMYHNGTDWIANGQLLSDGNKVRIGTGVPFAGFFNNVKFGVDGLSLMTGAQWLNGGTTFTGGPLTINDLYNQNNNGTNIPGTVLTNVNGDGVATWQPGFSLPTNATSGQVLTWNSTTSTWEPGGAVTPNGSTHGDTLWWDNNNLVWVSDQNLRNDGTKVAVGTYMPGMPGDARLQINKEGDSMQNDWWQHPFAIQGTSQTLFAGVDSSNTITGKNAYFQSAGEQNGQRVASGIVFNPQGGNVRIGSTDPAQGGWPIWGWLGGNIKLGVQGMSLFRGDTWTEGQAVIGLDNPDLSFKLNVDGGTTSPLNGIVSNVHGPAWSYGILSKVGDPYTKALAVQDTTTGLENFRVYGNGETFTGGKLTVNTGTNTGDVAELLGDGNVIIKPGEDTGEVLVGSGSQLGLNLRVDGNIYAQTPNAPSSPTGWIYVDDGFGDCDTSIGPVSFNYQTSMTGDQVIDALVTSVSISQIEAACTGDLNGNSLSNTTLIQTSNSSCLDGTPSNSQEDCNDSVYQGVSGGQPYLYDVSAYPTGPLTGGYSNLTNGASTAFVQPRLRIYKLIQSQVTGAQGNFFGWGAKLKSLSDDPDGDGNPTPDGILEKICGDDNGWIVPCAGAGVDVAPGDTNGQTLRWQEPITNPDGTITPGYWKHNDNNFWNDGITVRAEKPLDDSLLACFPPNPCPTKPLIFSAKALDQTLDQGISVDVSGKTQVVGRLEVLGNTTLKAGNTTVGTQAAPNNLRVWGEIDARGGIVNGTNDSGIPGVSGFPEGDAGQVIVDDPTYISNSLGISAGLKTFFGNVVSGQWLKSDKLAHQYPIQRPLCAAQDGLVVPCDVSGSITFYPNDTWRSWTVPAGATQITITAIGGGGGGGGGTKEESAFLNTGNDEGHDGGGGGGAGQYVVQSFAVGNSAIHSGETLFISPARGGGGGAGGAHESSSYNCADTPVDGSLGVAIGSTYAVICGITNWIGEDHDGANGFDGTSSRVILADGTPIVVANGGQGGIRGGNGGNPGGGDGGNGNPNGDGGGGGAGGTVIAGFSQQADGPSAACIPGGVANINDNQIPFTLLGQPFPNSDGNIEGSSQGGRGGRGGADESDGCGEHGGNGEPGSTFGGGGGGGGGAGDSGFLGGVRSGGDGAKGGDGVVVITWQ